MYLLWSYRVLQDTRMLPSIIASVLTFLLPGIEGSAILYDNSTQNGSKEECMKELGCFSITDEFQSLPHGINVLAFNRDAINTRFLLYTRKNAKQPHLYIASEKETFEESYFDLDDPVKFLVHGFLETFSKEFWIHQLKDELLIHGEYNIIMVDWTEGNKPPYFQAAANSRVVGAEMVAMIEALEKYKGINRGDVHIIAHSLGAHSAGYAGAELKDLKRISGLDPAGLYFENMPPSERLDPSDADFVDVIHSNAAATVLTGYGITKNVGHIDFYPNGGEAQPGCEIDGLTFITEGLNGGIYKIFACNHLRSIFYFIYSINYIKVTPVGFECTNYEDFLDGKCADCGSETEKCAVMGMRAYEYYQNKNSSIQRALYLKTGPEPPFFLYHFQVNIKLHKPQTSYKNVTGSIAVTLSGSKADELANIQNKPTDLNMGSQYQYLVTTKKELGEIMNVSLKWSIVSFNPKDIIIRPKLYVEYISVIPMNTIEKSPRNMTDRVFCEEPEEGIYPSTTAIFPRNNVCLKFL